MGIIVPMEAGSVPLTDRLESSTASALFVAFDAMDFGVAARLANEGRMPNVAKLLAFSPHARVDNPVGFVVGGIWPSFRTGRRPASHGRHCYVQLDVGTYDFVPVAPDGIDGTHFWADIAATGRQVLVMDMPFSVAVAEAGGVQIVDWGSHDRRVAYDVVPESEGDRILETYGEHPVQPKCDNLVRDGRWSDLRDALLVGARTRTDILLDELSRGDFGFVGTVFSESHCAGHQFWKVHDPDYVDHDGDLRRELGDPFVEVYETLDVQLGRLLDALPDALVYVHLSHGMGPHHDGDHLLPEILRRLDGPATQPGVRERLERLTHRAKGLVRPLVPHRYRRVAYQRRRTGVADRVRDERRTQRFFHHPNNTMYSGIRINLGGREPQGNVARDELDETIAWLVAELEALVDPATGNRLVTKVHRVSDLYDGPHLDELPDLVVDWNRDAPISRASSPTIGTVTGRYASTRSGDHRLDGHLFVTGPGTENLDLGDSVDLVDLAPTIAGHFGVILDGIDGRPIPGLCDVRVSASKGAGSS